MFEKTKFYSFCFTLFGIVLINGCTENPFFEDSIKEKQNRIIKGKVLLSDVSNPGQVYIWLEGFNLATWTDNKGEFSLEIPQPQAQPGGGLNGIFNLYAYIANYEINITPLLILHGQFEYGKGALDSKGNLSRSLLLNKILDLKTSLEPNSILNNHKDPILFTVRLENLIDSIIVGTYHNTWNSPSCLIFRPLEKPIDQAILVRGNPGLYKEIVIDTITTWQMIYQFTPGFFQEGNYGIIPYLQIIQANIPAELIKSIDENVLEFNYSYLKLPLKQQPAILEVIEFGSP